MIVDLQDTFSMASKLTPKKVANAASIWRSYHQSKRAKKSTISGLPYAMAIEPTTSCNLRCPECPSGLRSFSRPTGMLDKQKFKETIEDVKDHLIYLTFYFQGEPYLNPQFLEMVNLASANGIYTTTSTNAHYLDEENARKTVESGLDRLIISIDGATQETYQAYRLGGKLEKVIEGTENVIRWKKQLKRNSPKVVWQFLVVGPNEHEIPEIKSLARKHKVDKVLFKTAQIYDYENGSELIPVNAKYSRYKKLQNGSYGIKNDLEDKCWKMWHSCVITWDGQVIPCCFDKDATHSFGNVNESSLREIWNSEAYDRFRNAILRSRSEIEICKNCTEGLKVWA